MVRITNAILPSKARSTTSSPQATIPREMEPWKSPGRRYRRRLEPSRAATTWPFIPESTTNTPTFAGTSPRNATVSTFVGYSATTGGFKVRASNYTIDGFDLNFANLGAQGAIFIYEQAHNTWVLNNPIRDGPIGRSAIYVAGDSIPEPGGRRPDASTG